MRCRTWAYSLALLVMVGPPARAIIVIADNPDKSAGAPPYLVSQTFTTDPAYTNGPYANSGSQYEGQWITTGFVGGTAIAPNWFITSSHVGGAAGNVFIQNGTVYTATGTHFDVGNQMTIWQVNGTFSSYAPIFANSGTSNPVTGAVTSSFGYGDAPDLSAPVTGPNGLQGYQWAGSTNNLSWGPSSVLGYVSDSGNTYVAGAFRPDLGAPVPGMGNVSSTFAAQDSGGGLFVRINGIWSLAAVHFGVDGPYVGGANTTPKGSDGPFNASLWDQQGFTIGGQTASGPQQWYSSNITPAVLATIQSSIASVPEPAAFTLLAGGAVLAAVGRRRLFRRRA